MNWVFLVLLCGHTCWSVINNIREARRQNGQTDADTLTPEITMPRRYRWELVLQAPAFYLACYFAYRYGVFSRELISPLHIGLGLLAGHLVFGASLLITHRCLRDAWAYFVDFGSLWAFFRENPVIIGRFLLVGFSEEVIWRVAAQPMVIDIGARLSASVVGEGVIWPGIVAGVLLVAVLFSVAHQHFFVNTLVVSIEFLGFAILLGVLYHITSSFILVIVIHALRDIEITYLEYLIKVDELGDEAEAARIIEESILRRPRPEHT